MTIITTRLTVTKDGTISTAAPIPAGQHDASIRLRETPRQPRAAAPFDTGSLPTLDLGPWPEGLSLTREDMYGDEGR